jgi:hypothetical protein
MGKKFSLREANVHFSLLCVLSGVVRTRGTVDFRGQLYMVAKSSQEETGKEAGEGIEIIQNHPYAVDDPVNKYKMEKGQYTYVSWRELASLMAHCSSLVDVDA